MGVVCDDHGGGDGDGRCDCNWGEDLLRRAWAELISGGDPEYYSWLVDGRANDDRPELLPDSGADPDTKAYSPDINPSGVLSSSVLQRLRQRRYAVHDGPTDVYASTESHDRSLPEPRGCLRHGSVLPEGE
jgi:hypothetical protein